MCVHLMDALKKGATTVQVRTVETDVVVILISLCPSIVSSYPQTNIWVVFGMGKAVNYFHINTISALMGNSKSQALAGFHAFTGCDTTSQFRGKGKKTAIEAWKCFPEVTEAFETMMKKPFVSIEIESPTFKLLERFVCVLYDKYTECRSVNKCRQQIFSKRTQNMDAIPPTQVDLRISPFNILN